MIVGFSKEEFKLLLADSFINKKDRKQLGIRDKIYKVLKKKKLIIRFI